MTNETELTERKKADSELHKAYEQIQHAIRERCRLFNEELQVQSEELQVNKSGSPGERQSVCRTLAEILPDIITRLDRQKRHVYANPEASDAYGLSQEDNHWKISW